MYHITMICLISRDILNCINCVQLPAADLFELLRTGVQFMGVNKSAVDKAENRENTDSLDNHYEWTDIFFWSKYSTL